MARNKNARPARAATALLLCLLLCGALLLALWGKGFARMLYPRRYAEYVDYFAEKYDLDPLLLYSFIRTESNFLPNARSDAGAHGLMQITEETFDWIKSNIAPTEALTFASLDDPETSIRFGSYFVSYCLERYGGDIPTAAAAYHSGWGTVDALLEDERYTADGTTLTVFPYPNMRTYVHKITAAYDSYRRLYAPQ